MSSEEKIWIVVRKDLKMSKGKMAVQVAHACVGCIARLPPWTERALDYVDDGQPKIVCRTKDIHSFTKLVVDASSVAKENFYGKRRLPFYIVQDLGRTEFEEPTFTCAAFGPCRADQLPKSWRRLQLWKDEEVVPLS